MLDVSGIFAGILLGLSLGVPPGPVNAAIAAESVKKSYFQGILVGLGAMTSDFCFLILTVIGVSVLLTGATARMVISVFGGLILLYLAVMTFRNYRSPPPDDSSSVLGHPYVKGFLLAMTNPMGIVWWATAGAAFVALFNILGVMGFLLGLFSWICSLALAVHFAKSRFTAVYPAIMLASSVCLFAFGAILLSEVIRPVLGV